MIRYHGQHAARNEPVPERWQRCIQGIHLVIHRDPDGLEQSREISGAGPFTKRAANGADEVVTDDKWAVAASAHYLAREPARMRLITVLAKNARELRFVGFVEKPGGGLRSLRIHSHVERCAFAK